MKKSLRKNKKALSPLIATLILLAFALVIGTATMNWGKGYIEKTESGIIEESGVLPKSAIVINIKDLDTPLKKLMIQHLTGQISEQEYFTKEKVTTNP